VKATEVPVLRARRRDHRPAPGRGPVPAHQRARRAFRRHERQPGRRLRDRQQLPTLQRVVTVVRARPAGEVHVHRPGQRRRRQDGVDHDKPQVGSGSQQIVAVEPGRSVTTRLDFGDQQATSTLTIEAEGSGSRITWAFDTSFEGNFLGRYFGLFFDRMIGTDYEKASRSSRRSPKRRPPPSEALHHLRPAAGPPRGRPRCAGRP